MRKRAIVLILIVCLILLCSCGHSQDEPITETQPSTGTEKTSTVTGEMPGSDPEELSTGTETDQASGLEEETVPPTEPVWVQRDPETKEEIGQLFWDAMLIMREEIRFDISGMTWEFGAENDLKNIWYPILNEHPELKYTYALEVSVSEDTAVCKFSYMPYVTGAYDTGVPVGSYVIESLSDAKAAAQSMNDGAERLSIAITEPSLSVEDIQRALMQAGYGWFTYTLSREGTEIIAAPPWEKNSDECVSAINESFRLGGKVLEKVITGGMTEREKVRALYDYIVDTVEYDFRYYSDRNSMPYESMVALGALRDGLAICGGYAQAFQMMLDLCDIENYTVSGISSGEHHMWNYVVLDGVGYYCDPTADRGGMSNHFMLTEDEFNAKGKYTWDDGFCRRIGGIER